MTGKIGKSNGELAGQDPKPGSPQTKRSKRHKKERSRKQRVCLRGAVAGSGGGSSMRDSKSELIDHGRPFKFEGKPA